MGNDRVGQTTFFQPLPWRAGRAHGRGPVHSPRHPIHELPRSSSIGARKQSPRRDHVFAARHRRCACLRGLRPGHGHRRLGGGAALRRAPWAQPPGRRPAAAQAALLVAGRHCKSHRHALWPALLPVGRRSSGRVVCCALWMLCGGKTLAKHRLLPWLPRRPCVTAVAAVAAALGAFGSMPVHRAPCNVGAGLGQRE